MRGAQKFEFEFELGGCVVLDVHCIVRFGRIQEVIPYFQNHKFDTEGIVIDWYDEFLPMEKTLLLYAQQFYNEAKQLDDEEPIIFIPEYE
jgi:hypothetical protein